LGPSGEAVDGDSEAEEPSPLVREVARSLSEGLSVVTAAEALDGASDAEEANSDGKEVGLSVVTSAEALEEEG
jgi:hypothetical protein